MPIDPKNLPQDPVILQQMLVDLTAQLDKTQRLLRPLLAAKSGTRSEQISADQLQLFAQELGISPVMEEKDEGGADQKPDPPAATGSGSGDEKKPRGRQALPRHLKRERLVHDLAEADKHCRTCGEDVRRMGEEVSERYEYIPAQMKVIEDACQKYACSCKIVTATKPAQPIEKSTASASVLAQVIVSKVADHLPLHRQAKMFRRFGIALSDQTLCGWLRQSAELLAPLYERAKAFVFSSKVVGTDDTPVKVLDRSLPHTRKGRFWPYVGDREHRAVVYDYTPTRERAGPGEVSRRIQRLLTTGCLPGLRRVLSGTGAGIGRSRLLGARQAACVSSARDRSGAHGCGTGLHRTTVCGGEACSQNWPS